MSIPVQRSGPSKRASGLLVGVLAVGVLFAACARTPTEPAVTPSTEASVTPQAVDFDTVVVASEHTREFQVTNSGHGPLTSRVLSVHPAFVVLDSAAFMLDPQQSIGIHVMFHPVVTGAMACTLEVANTAARVVCMGVSSDTAAFAACSLSTQSIDFGEVEVGSYADRSLTIFNTGPVNLNGRVETCGVFSVAGIASYALAPGASQQFTIRFSPSDTTAQACDLMIGSSACGPVALSGKGTPATPQAPCYLTPTEIDFGDVVIGATAETTVYIHNTTDHSIYNNGSGCGPFHFGAFDFMSIPPGVSALTVRFTPAIDGPVSCSPGLSSCLTCGPACGTILCKGRGVIAGEVISTDTRFGTAGSPYEFSTDVTIVDGATLTIDPGVELRFEPGTTLYVGGGTSGGVLVADASNGAPIRFTGTSAVPGSWGGVVLRSTATGATYDGQGNYVSGSILRNCVVEYATAVIAANNPAIECTIIRQCSGVSSVGRPTLLMSGGPASKRRIIGCRLEDNTGGGIYVEGNDVAILGTEVQNNGDTGIMTGYSTVLSVTDCVVTANTAASGGAGGIWVRDGSSFSMAHTTVSLNSGDGVFFDSPSSVAVGSCNLVSNQAYNVRWGDAFGVSLAGNWWGTTDPATIGAGVYDCKQSGVYGCVGLTPVLTAPATVTPLDCAPAP